MNEATAMIKTAKFHLNTKHRVLAPMSEARVEWAEYDPCRPVQIIARVYWPATVAMKDTVLCHAIKDGDKLLA